MRGESRLVISLRRIQPIFAIWGCLVSLAAWADAAPTGSLGNAWEDPRNPVLRIFGGQRLDLWSLRPVKLQGVPSVDSLTAEPTTRRSPLDAWLQSGLSRPSELRVPEADSRTLIRRLSLDLTGLPPSVEDVESFERECVQELRSAGGSASQAYERLVDRLLASPRYGEHQARQWLDVIRYSDSNGFDWDEFRPRAWRFRDYVIRAFNADKPFDRFIVEQLAGDELLEGPPRDVSEQDALIATGYLRLGPHDNAAGLFNEQDRSRAELMADLTETTSSAFLGLTMSCCRCHDHKFDPLLQADHFRLRAFFEGVKFADDLPLDLVADQAAIREHNAGLERQRDEVEVRRQTLLAPHRERLRAERLARLTEEERQWLKAPDDRHPEERRPRVATLRKQVEPKESELKAALEGDAKTRHAELEKQITQINSARREFTTGLLMTDQETRPAETRILVLGDHKRLGQPVVPGFLSILDPNPALISKPANLKTLGRRLALARWIASSENPLTARVFVNRLWQQHFGQGLVDTPNDFGLAGSRPSHPELLDWLAAEFVRGGWSVKHLHRTMLLSAAYRQAVVDPGSLSESLGFRRSPRRLSAEQLRDALLATSGSLQLVSGGSPVWPDLPAEILQANPAFLDDNATRTKGWYPSPGERQSVRSMFLVQKRTVRVPFMETFDLPENSTSCARRTGSTVAPQALSLLHSPLAVEASQELAKRVRQEAGNEPEAQVRQVFRITLQRAPKPEERDACLRLLRRRSLPELCRILINLNEFAYVD
ncbi:MAG: DUF1553 domain-containing protein [Pedosphaera sp.]|nr:DUF1553 domain-containing protein [Pedosphaera sp.]